MTFRPLLVFCTLACAASPDGRAEAEDSPAPIAQPSPAPQLTPLTNAQLDQLFAPVALYPDPLIAIILPASTFPADLVLAARFLRDGGKPEAIDAQDWDDSVKSLARYPEVLKWMDENLAWTRQAGSAFAQQPADVLTCTQRLRAAAKAAGNLKDTPEQKIVVEHETIRIVPANPEIIYVPVYEPSWVYGYRSVDFDPPGPLIRFSSGYRTGYWLSYHCDWTRWNVVVISRPYRVAYWREYPRWSCPSPAVAQVHHVWHTSAQAGPRVTLRDAQPGPTRLTPIQGAAVVSQPVARPTPQNRTPAPAASDIQAPTPLNPSSAPRRGHFAQVNDARPAQIRGSSPQELSRPVSRPNRPVVIPAQSAGTIVTGSEVQATASATTPSAPAQRLEFPATNAGGGALNSGRPRSGGNFAAPAAAAPLRTNSSEFAGPRRPANLNPAPASVPAARASARSGAGVSAGSDSGAPALSRSRGQTVDGSNGFPSLTTNPDGESSSSRRRH